MKQTISLKTLILIAMLALLTGCGTTLTRQTFDSVKTPISVARLKTPDIYVQTWGRDFALAMVAAAAASPQAMGAFGAVPVAANSIAATATEVAIDKQTAAGNAKESPPAKQMWEGCAIPDLGYEITSQFTTIWRKQDPVTKMVLVESPVADNHKFPGASIVLQVTAFIFNLGGYFNVGSKITMNDDSGKIIYTIGIPTRTVFLDRTKHTFEEYTENNCILLKEEIKFLSKYIAEDLIKEMRSELQR